MKLLFALFAAVVCFALGCFIGLLIPSPLQLSPPNFFSEPIAPLVAQAVVNGPVPADRDDVEQVYLDLLKEAERRSETDFSTSHRRGERGVVIGPVDGEFRQTVKSMQNARRIRNISRRIRIALITSKAHLELLSTCNEGSGVVQPKEVTQEACHLWANGTLFDDVMENWEPPWTNESHARQSGGNSRYWMKSMAGALLAPYKETLVLDSDSYPCPGFEKLFAVLRPYSEKLWALPSTATVDLAIGLEQYPRPSGQWSVLGDLGIYSDFQFFSTRNCGTVLWNFHRQLPHTFVHFLLLVAEHMYNNVATPTNIIVNEQVPFKVALYLFKKLKPSFNEQNFPFHASCRTYPDKNYAGVDGARNGMYPVQSNGKICNECHCTPCLINHLAGAHFVTINGKKGWEDGEFIEGGSNSLP